MNGQMFTGQGTRLSDVPPWMSYAAEMEDNVSPQLQAEIADYATRRHDKSSAQNEEELARWREGNAEIAKDYVWLHPREYADEGPRIGTIIHSSAFITLLREKCGVRCWYRQHPHRDKLTLMVQPNTMFPPEVGCWAQTGFAPEYSLLRFDQYGLVLNEKMRGWRTCLLQLIIKRVLTEQQAEQCFGKAVGPASERYNMTLYGFRNEFKDNGGE